MDGQAFVSTPMPRAASRSWDCATRVDRAPYEARRTGIPLEPALVDGKIVLRATRWDGGRLDLAGRAEGLAERFDEIAGPSGPAPAHRSDCR